MQKLAIFLIIVLCLLPLSISPLGTPSEGNLVTASAQVIARSEEQNSKHYTNIPILMYHVLEDYSGTYEQLYVGPQVFRQQLAYLQEQGYQTVTLRQVLEHWTQAKPLPDNPVVISFDDGYRSMYTQAFPLLREFGYQGTFYLHTAKIDTAGGLTRAMIQEMVAGGMEIGSHTIGHPDLTKISSVRLSRELKESKQALEAITGSPVQTFAYPAGRYNQRVQAAVDKAGYIGAVTTQYGIATQRQNPLTLKRIRINKSDGLDGFIAKMSKAKPL